MAPPVHTVVPILLGVTAGIAGRMDIYPTGDLTVWSPTTSSGVLWYILLDSVVWSLS